MRIRLTLILLACLSLPALALADDDAITAANRQVFAGMGGQRLQYAEEVYSTDIDYEFGKQAAATAGASWQGNLYGLSSVLLEGQYWFARGKTKYVGFLQDLQNGSVTPWVSSTNDETADWMMRFGKGFEEGGGIGMITPYFAIGEHRWVRDSSTTDPYGYLEVYKHKFAEVGAIAQARMAPRLVAGLELNAGSSFGAEVGVPSQGLSLALRSERILGLAVNLDFAVAKHLHAKIEYRDTSFRYGKSHTVNLMYEPDSATIQSTALLTLGYAF
jgi:hypothetical protein